MRPHLSLDQQQRDQIVVIAGVGYQTLFRLAYKAGFFGLWEKTDKIFNRVLNNAHCEGDGRVPSRRLCWRTSATLATSTACTAG